MPNERFRWLSHWIVREFHDPGLFFWRTFLMVVVLCLIAYYMLQRFGGRVH